MTTVHDLIIRNILNNKAELEKTVRLLSKQSESGKHGDIFRDSTGINVPDTVLEIGTEAALEMFTLQLYQHEIMVETMLTALNEAASKNRYLAAEYMKAIGKTLDTPVSEVRAELDLSDLPKAKAKL